MKTLHFLRVELGRLARRPAMWAVAVLTALSPLAGLTLYRPLYSVSLDTYATSMAGMYIANPALAGGLIGACLFALLTVLELDRTHRHRVDALMDAVLSPHCAAAVRLMTLLTAAAAVQAAVMLLWLPMTMHWVGAVFDFGTYFLSYLILMFGALPLAVLFAAAAYQITTRADLTLMLFLAFAALNLTVWSQNWQLRWLNPAIFAVSDDFSNNRLFQIVAFMRLTWLVALAGLWAVSYLCIRRYGKGLPGSLAGNMRRAYRPLVAVLLLAVSGAAYVRQPFFDHSAPFVSNWMYETEVNEAVSCSERYADVRPDAKTGRVSGTARYQLHNKSGQMQQIEFQVNPGYAIGFVTANGKTVPYAFLDKQENGDKYLAVELPAENDIELEISYGGYPQTWNIVSLSSSEPEISDRYMRMENSLLSPSLYDVPYSGDTLPATLDLTLPAHMEPVPFGSAAAERKNDNGDGTITWRIKDSGYNMIVYAGDYISEQLHAAGLDVTLYYGRKHEQVMRELDVKNAVRQVLEYCTEHYGPLSFYADGKLKLLQTRASGGGYAGDGASTMDELDFTATNLRDADKGGTAGEVVIHELVHQWWGMGNMFDDDGVGLWSAEGLTTYTTYRIVKEQHGEAYAKKYYVDRWREQVDDYYKNFYVRHPEFLDALPEAYQANIANSLSGMRRYAEMPLKILKAEQLVGGEEQMDRILSRLFQRELDYSFPYLTYADFLNACGLTEEALELA